MNTALDVLCLHLQSYLTLDQVAAVRAAYVFAERAHGSQMRRDGTPYITHPLAVAEILAQMHMDHQSLMAAMLHDVIEDTGISKSELAHMFGDEVTELVDGVTKLEKVGHISKAEAKAENLQKMMLAMARDIRVIIVKLADRLHNMRTLYVLKPEKRARIAKETLDIYAPFAHRLGMHDMRIELEDLCFFALHSMRAPRINNAVKATYHTRQETTTYLQNLLKNRLKDCGIEAQILDHKKHLFGIYQRMREQTHSFSEIMSVYSFRVVVKDIDTCYRTLGIIHNLFKPIPGKFKDYIAIPKANGYQSLHSLLKAKSGVPVEVQIRTDSMEAIANKGVAAYWLYRDTIENRSQMHAKEWLSSLIELQEKAGNSLDFIENVCADLSSNEIYVFTPTGKIITLPQGATPIDFAYAVHSDIGNSCVAAKIDGYLSPVSLVLKTGQTIEIVTAPHAMPNPYWLNFVVTSKARSSIRQTLKEQQHSQSLYLGKNLLEKALSVYQTQLANIAPETLNAVLKELHLSHIDHLLMSIGLGHHAPQLVAQRLLNHQTPAIVDHSKRHLTITGTEGLILNYAPCCYPLPGDSIIGHVKTGRGINIHRDSCQLLLTELREHPEKCVHLQWDIHIDREFNSELRIEVVNQRGILANITQTASQHDINITKLTTSGEDTLHAVIHLILSVKSRVHLAQIIKRLRVLDGVEKVSRVKN